MRYVVTGGAGFIGSTLVDRLLADGHMVTAYDNFSTGQRQFLDQALTHPAFQLIEGDLLDLARLTDAVAGHDAVFHLAANADVRFGTQHPRKDLDQNTIATFHVLEAPDPALAIVEFAERTRVDHIVMGARGHSALRRYLGSVSSQVVAQAPCTVTVVRA